MSALSLSFGKSKRIYYLFCVDQYVRCFEDIKSKKKSVSALRIYNLEVKISYTSNCVSNLYTIAIRKPLQIGQNSFAVQKVTSGSRERRGHEHFKKASIKQKMAELTLEGLEGF